MENNKELIIDDPEFLMALTHARISTIEFLLMEMFPEKKEKMEDTFAKIFEPMAKQIAKRKETKK